MLSLLLRPFRFQPLYAFACVVTLALAVAAAVTSFAVVKRAILDPLPVRRWRSVGQRDDIGRRSHVIDVGVRAGRSEGRCTADVLAGIAQVRYSSPTYQTADAAETLQAQEVTAAFFDTLGVRPAIGACGPTTEPNAVIVSWRLLAAVAVGRSECDRPRHHARRHVATRRGRDAASVPRAVRSGQGCVVAARHAAAPRRHRARPAHRVGVCASRRPA